jgi:VanZ family protein
LPILDHLGGLRTAKRVAAWSCLIAIGALSLAPAERMTRTGLGGHIEHLAAYAATALAVGVAYADHGVLRIALALLAYAGCLEVLQQFSPGRTSSFLDFTMSSAGALIGIVAFALLKWSRRPGG